MLPSEFTPAISNRPGLKGGKGPAFTVAVKIEKHALNALVIGRFDACVRVVPELNRLRARRFFIDFTKRTVIHLTEQLFT
jgi:hypothetical protein